jgi:hypothetical protein
MVKKMLIVIAVSLFIPCGYLKAQTLLQSEVETEFARFKNSGIDILKGIDSLVFTNEASSHITAGSKVVHINLNEINKAVAGQSTAFRKIFIQYVIGHELGHNMQFKGYQKGVLEKGNGTAESSVFLECNADLLAGIFITIVQQNELNTRQATQPGFNMLQFAQETNKETFNLYSTIYNMPVTSGAKTHPGNNKRLLAFKEGILAGKCLYFSWVKYDAQNAQYLSYNEFEGQKNLYRQFGKALGYNPYNAAESNPFVWAHLEAIRIVNNSDTYAKQLIIFNRVVEQRPQTGTVYFSFDVLNNNTVAVNFVGRVYTEMIQQFKPEELILNAPLDGEQFNRTIQPAEKITISGELKTINEGDYTSRLILPGDLCSLYYVFDATPNPTMDYNNVFAIVTDFSKWNSNTITDVTDHIADIEPKRQNLFKYAGGVAVVKRKKFEGVTTALRSYEPTFKTGADPYQKINYFPTSGKCYYEFSVNTGTYNASEAIKKFNGIVDAIKSELSYTAADLEQSDSYIAMQFYDAGTDKVAVEVVLSKLTYSRIDITINGN